MSTPNEQFMRRLTESLVESISPKSILVVNPPPIEPPKPTDFPSLFKPSQQHCVRTFFETKFENEETFDLVLGSIPMGIRNPPGEKSTSPLKSWDLFLTFSDQLSSDGYGIFLMEPKGFYRKDLPRVRNRSKEFVQLMEKKSVYIDGYINLPEKILEPCTGLQPVLVILSRKKRTFKVLDLSHDDEVEDRVEKFFISDVGDENLTSVDRSSFRGFRPIEVSRQIDNLETRYKEFRRVTLENLTLGVVKGKKGQDFDDTDNSVFFKFLGSNSDLYTKKDQLTGRTDNYLQIQLVEEINNDYLKIFFQSSLGRLVLDYSMNSSFIPRLDSDVLLSTDIPVPELHVQNQVVETHRRLEVLLDEVEQMKSQISLNPLSSFTSSKIDEMLQISSSLSEGDQIKSLILMGESRKLEFKQTFQYCLRTKQKQENVEVSCMKTLVGFMNSEGGTLLVGVEDSGLIPGVDFEREKFHKKSNDKFLLHIKDKIKTRIGLHFLQFLNTSVVEVDQVSVIKIVCSPSDEEVFLDDKDFYVRNSPSTDKLEGRDLSRYVRKRFHG